MKPPYAIGSVPSLSGHAIAYRWRLLPRVRRHRASKPQGSSERVLPRQVTMDQIICASLSHTHYWYDVGMFKALANTVPHGGSRKWYPRNWPFPLRISFLFFVPSCCCFLTLTDPLRIQPWSQDRRNQTKSNRESVRASKQPVISTKRFVTYYYRW